MDAQSFSYKSGRFFSRARLSSFYLLVAAHPAAAIELSGIFSSEVEYSSNAERLAARTPEDVVQRAELELGFAENGKRVRADGSVSIEHERYWNESYDDETSVRSGFGLFSVDLVEDLLNWHATFSRTDVVSDSTQDDTPDNREFRNIFRTGPTLTYAFSRAAQLSLTANYINLSNSSETAVDSQRAEANLGYQYLYNSLTSLTASLSHEEILESDNDEDIANSALSIGLTRLTNGGSVSVNVGVQRVETERVSALDQSVIEDDTNGNFFDIEITRDNFFGQELKLSYLEEVSDTSIGFQSDQTGIVDENSRITAVSGSDIETRRRLSLEASRQFDWLSYDASLSYQESDFERADNTERYRNLAIGVQSLAYARFQPRLEYRYTRENFTLAGNGEDLTRSYRGSIRYQAVEDLYLNAYLEFEKVDNDENLTRESEEFQVGIGLRWAFL